jgi:hypothetical protein
MKSPRPTVILLLVLAAPCAPAADDHDGRGEIHLCRDENGVVVYQEAPCEAPRTTRPTPSKEPPRVAPKAVPPPPPRIVEKRPPAKAPPRGSDPRYATPEATWKTFVEALATEDGAAVLACLTGDARAKAGSDLAALRATVAAIARIETEGEAGPYWSLRGSRPGRPPKWVLLERADGGNWKISVF